MSPEEFAQKRHICWDYNPFSERLEQGFCICDDPWDNHTSYKADQGGDLARSILEEKP